MTPRPRSLRVASGELRSRGPFSTRAAIAVTVTPLVAVAAAELMREAEPWDILVVLVAVFGALLGGSVFAQSRAAIRGVVTVGDTGLLVDGVMRLRRRDVTSADLLLAADGVYVVRLARRGWWPAVDVVVRDEDEADAVQDALALGGSGARVTFGTGDLVALARLGVLVALVALGTTVLVMVDSDARFRFGMVIWQMVIMVALLAAIGLTTRVVAGWRRVTVGADGVLLVDALGRQQLLAHREIDDLGFDGGDFVVRSRGSTQRFPLRQRKSGGATRARAYWRAELARRVLAARTAGQQGGESNVALLDDPAALTLAEGSEGAGYRVAAVSRDAVWAIVGDPGAPAPARLRAAVALRVRADEVSRLRAVAQSVAASELHDALESLADENEENVAARPEAV